MSSNNYESYFSMSISYLDVGAVSSKHKDNTGEYQNAVAYQLYHALELFIKYAILKNKGSVTLTHDLDKLFDTYYSLYPDEMFRIEHPFDFRSYKHCELNIDEQEKYEQHISKFNPKIMDQHLRYPPDHKTGGYSYKVESSYFMGIKGKLIELHRKINC